MTFLLFFASYCPYYWDTRPKFSLITEKRKGELKIHLDLLLTNYKLLPTGKSDPSKKMLQHNQLENCGEQVFVIENLLFLECMLLKKIGKQVPFRKCLPPGVYEERNMFKDEKMFKLQDCPGSFSQIKCWVFLWWNSCCIIINYYKCRLDRNDNFPS